MKSEKMSIEQAKELLHPVTSFRAIAEIEYHGGFSGGEKVVQALLDARIIACEAMEKQIPKKPLYKKKERKSEGYYSKTERYICPDCGAILFTQNHREKTQPGFEELNRWPQGMKTRHCSYCGRAIDWSDYE